MNLGIITVCYNGYGKFLDKWLLSVSQLNPKPTQITVVLGKDHGARIPLPENIHVVFAEGQDNMGRLRNLGMLDTPTEWVSFIDVDDDILPWAIKEFESLQNSDIIVSKYLVLGPKSLCVHPRVSKEVLLSAGYYLGGPNYMHSATPFRRELWLKNLYKENECCNALFWIDCASTNPRFSHTDVPCFVYNIRDGSHSHIDNNERMKRSKIINDHRKTKT